MNSWRLMQYGLWLFLGVPFGGIPLLYLVFTWYGRVSSAQGDPYVFLPNAWVLILLLFGLWVCFGLALLGLALVLAGFVRHFCWNSAPVTAPKFSTRRYIAGVNWTPILVSLQTSPEVSTPEPTHYYLLLNHRREGPFPYADLVDRLYSGKVSASILGCEQDTETWVPLRDLLITTGFKCSICGAMPVKSLHDICCFCAKSVKAKPVPAMLTGKPIVPAQSQAKSA